MLCFLESIGCEAARSDEKERDKPQQGQPNHNEEKIIKKMALEYTFLLEGFCYCRRIVRRDSVFAYYQNLSARMCLGITVILQFIVTPPTEP